MTSKAQRDEYSARRDLQDFGADVRKRDAVAFNSGSETLEHFIAKAVTAYILREKGYRIDSEVEFPHGELDILGYANGEGDKIGVELETDISKDIISRKLDQFYTNTPLRECYVLSVDDLPSDIHAIADAIRGEL